MNRDDTRRGANLYLAQRARPKRVNLPVDQLVDDALELHLAGQVSRLDVTVHDDHFSVCDDGPGVSRRDLAPAMIASGRPRGRLGRVNELAHRVEIETCRHGAYRRWVFEDSVMVVDGEALARGSRSGTRVRVWPDPQVFERVRPDMFALEQRLLGIHRLRPALTVTLDGARFDEPAGAQAWVSGARGCGGDPIHHLEMRRGTTEIELAWAWLRPFGPARRLSYVNLEETREDGSHVDGLLAGLARAHGVSIAMARECTLALVSVISVNPRFAGGARDRLRDPTLGRWIAELVERHHDKGRRHCA